MSNIDLLKQELIKQKGVIEGKSGVVQVVGTNPSPYEITAGIQSIPMNDVSDATATEADVSFGKTFYSGSHNIRTGTAMNNQGAVDALFMGPLLQSVYDDEIYYTFPSYVNEVRDYHFYYNNHSVTIYFNENLKILGDYTFQKCPNFKFRNFENIINLQEIRSYCFSESSTDGIEIGALPNTIKHLGAYCFYYNNRDGLDIKIPASLTSFGQYCYMQSERKIQNSLDISELTCQSLPNYSFYFNAFNCDLVIPSVVKTISTYFNYNGCFRNIYIPAETETVGNYCFGSLSSRPIDLFYLQTVTINREVPPSFGKYVFATQNMQNGLRIYVPDNVVDDYKNATNFTVYADYIFPMSQKD